MTVSAHLTPEPERRLWLILEGMRRAAAERELKLGALAVLAVMELALLPGAGLVARLALGLTLPLAVLGLAPVTRLPGWLGFLEASPRKASVDDCMIAPEDVSKYVLGELILKMDRYLGGGITATPYFEDIVAQILVGARLAERKRRLLAAVCVLIGAGHLALLVPPLAAAEPPKSALVQELETDLGSQWDALHDERRPSRPARKAAAVRELYRRIDALTTARSYEPAAISKLLALPLSFAVEQDHEDLRILVATAAAAGVTKVELRVGPGAARGLVVLNVDRSLGITPGELIDRYGEPVDIDQPSIHAPPNHPYYLVHERPGGKLSLGVAPGRTHALSTVVWNSFPDP